MRSASFGLITAIAIGAGLIFPMPRKAMADEGRSTEPPARCEIHQMAWCMLLDDMTYQDVPSTQENMASTWYLRGPLWKQYPLIINEPAGCRTGYSDIVKLVRFDRYYKVGEKTFGRIVVRLKKNGSCDLEMLSSKKSDDKYAGGFFAGLTSVKPCIDASCSGEVLAKDLRELVRPD